MGNWTASTYYIVCYKEQESYEDFDKKKNVLELR